LDIGLANGAEIQEDGPASEELLKALQQEPTTGHGK